MLQSMSEEKRKEIFLTLVQVQDEGVPPATSKGVIAQRFSISEADAKMIEREGLDHSWPPL